MGKYFASKMISPSVALDTSTHSFPSCCLQILSKASVSITGTFAEGFEITFDGGDVVGCSVPRLKIISDDLPSAVVTKIGPRTLTEQNSAFTYRFQRAADYVYTTKPAHIHVRELRIGGFRASISRVGETV